MNTPDQPPHFDFSNTEYDAAISRVDTLAWVCVALCVAIIAIFVAVLGGSLAWVK